VGDRLPNAGELHSRLSAYLQDVERSEEEVLRAQEIAIKRFRRRSRLLVAMLTFVLLLAGGVYNYTTKLLTAEKKAREAEEGEKQALAKAFAQEQEAVRLAKEQVQERERAREKLEKLLMEVQLHNEITTGLNSGRTAMREARWQDAQREFDRILQLAPESMDVREPRAQVLFNLRSPQSVAEYAWLAKQPKPERVDESSWRLKSGDFQIMAMIALLDFVEKSLEDKLQELRKLEREISHEGVHREIAWILIQSVEIKNLMSQKKPIGNRAGDLKAKLLELFEADHESALASYVIAIELEPHFVNRVRTLDLLGSAYAKNPDFLPSLMAHQRNCLWVICEQGFENERASVLIKSAQDDLVLLRERLPGRLEVDMAYIQCLVFKSRIRSYHREKDRLVKKAYQIAEGYLRMRGTPDYMRNASLVELSIALAAAARYERAKAQNLGIKEEFREAGREALKRAIARTSPTEDIKLQQHHQKKVLLVRKLLR
jgi:hypothetical protein